MTCSRAWRRPLGWFGLFSTIASMLAAAACDSASDPPPPSEFVKEWRFSRSAQGRVVSDLDPVDGALVRIDPSPTSGVDVAFDAGLGTSLSTTAAGTYRFEFAPWHYDLSVLFANEVHSFRDVYSRYFEPQIGGEAPARAFVSTVLPLVDPPVPEGSAVAFFGSGPDAIFVDDADVTRVKIGAQRFDAQISLHAVVYPIDRGIEHATAYGFVNVHVQANQSQTVALPVGPLVGEEVETTFDILGPAGTTVDRADLFLDFGTRRSARRFRNLDLGRPIRTAQIPFARWSYRVHGTVGGGETDTGLVFFEPAADTNTIRLPSPPSPLEASVEGVSGEGAGMLEHVLVPTDPRRPTLRILTMNRVEPLPDPTRFGLAAPSGTYTWTMRSWPTARDVGAASGVDAQTFPSASAAPRSIVVR